MIDHTYFQRVREDAARWLRAAKVLIPSEVAPEYQEFVESCDLVSTEYDASRFALYIESEDYPYTDCGIFGFDYEMEKWYFQPYERTVMYNPDAPKIYRGGSFSKFLAIIIKREYRFRQDKQ